MGKTDLFLRVACDLFIKHGCTTGWIRNKLVELSDNENYTAFLNDAYKHGWCPEEWQSRADGVYTSSDKDAAKVIEFKSISTFSNTRGAAHPDMLMVVFDEFMSEDRHYPRLCTRGLLSLCNTMLRGRDGSKIIMLSNNVSCANPYYAQFEIYPNPKYDVTIYRDKSIIMEQAYGYRKVVREDSDFARLMKAGKMPQYEDVRSDPLIGLIGNVPKGSRPAPYLILTDGKLFREWDKDGTRYYEQWNGDVPSNLVIYTPNVQEATDGVLILPTFLTKFMRETMELNLMRFKDPNVMFKILNIIYNAV